MQGDGALQPRQIGVNARVHATVSTANAPRHNAEQGPLKRCELTSERTTRVSLAWTSLIANLAGADLRCVGEASTVLGLAASGRKHNVVAFHLFHIEWTADSTSAPTSNPGFLVCMSISGLLLSWHANWSDLRCVRDWSVHLDERNVISELSGTPLRVIDQDLEATLNDPRLVTVAIVKTKKYGVARCGATETVSS